MFSCCLGVARNENLANLEIPGCTRGRHCSRHHSDHPYANYFSYMESLVRNVFVALTSCLAVYVLIYMTVISNLKIY